MEKLKTGEIGEVPPRTMIEATEIVNRLEIEDLALKLIGDREKLPEIEVKRQERLDNARTALMEALTASGHLSRIEITGNLEEINEQVLTRLLNGWKKSLPEHEKARRFAELCNELTIQEIHRLVAADMLPEDLDLTEISDYPTSMPDKQAEKLGYRADNKKGMVRTTSLRINDDGSFTRVIEQVSRSNGTFGSTFRLFDQSGFVNNQSGPADVVALSKPLLTRKKDYADGVVDLQRKLDAFSGRGVRYGERSSPLHVEYHELRQESSAREKQIEFYTKELADFEAILDNRQRAGEISESQKNTQCKQKVRSILEAICTLAPEYTRDCLGAKVERIFYQASNLVAAGRTHEAQSLIHENRGLQKTIVFCGVSISTDKADELGLKIGETSDLIEKGEQSWTYRKGVCRIVSCTSRPGKTDVGPCSICRDCQKRFDKGEDPTKDKVVPKKLNIEKPSHDTTNGGIVVRQAA